LIPDPKYYPGGEKEIPEAESVLCWPSDPETDLATFLKTSQMIAAGVKAP